MKAHLIITKVSKQFQLHVLLKGKILNMFYIILDLF